MNKETKCLKVNINLVPSASFRHREEGKRRSPGTLETCF